MCPNSRASTHGMLKSPAVKFIIRIKSRTTESNKVYVEINISSNYVKKVVALICKA